MGDKIDDGGKSQAEQILSSMEKWRTYAGKGPDLILCLYTILCTLSGERVVIIQEREHTKLDSPAVIQTKDAGVLQSSDRFQDLNSQAVQLPVIWHNLRNSGSIHLVFEARVLKNI